MPSDRERALDRIRTAAARIAASGGLEIFDLQFRRESIGWVLRVVLDRPEGDPEHDGSPKPGAGNLEGVTIDDCRRVSQDLSVWLDVDDEANEALGQKYTLEVSSPGLDRPLRGEADFRRFRGRLVKLVTREPIERQSSFAGRIAGVEDGAVLIEQGRRTHRVPLALVSRARLDVEF